MWRFIAFRAAAGIVTLIATSLIVYGALYFAPGSAANFLVSGRSVTPERIAEIEAQYHLNDSFLVQWWHWATAAVHGDFGRSLNFRDSVWSLIEPRLATTLVLIVYSALLTIGFGVTAGTVAGLRRGRTDGFVTILTSVCLAVPSFVAAVVLIAVFGVELGWFPTFGAGSSELVDRLYHLTLPAVALALAGGAYVARVTRTAIREEDASEYVATARSRGLPESIVIRRHIIRNALVPITTVSGLTLAGLIAGTVIVETAFGLNGLGALLIKSVETKDFAVVQAVTLLMVAGYIVVNVFVDVLYVLLDPRISQQSGRA